ncbi:hypothetical protein IYX23_15825 [Methylocystis sp. L43]|jgi:hypothetical protein|uniref:hypothetical protein n=1 Tax=unclassified Methylocystis TaxID=2625913 RepID=UPI0018C248FF|nr:MULTISPECIES: hypothetical protein [unclassified Methylocystis]MBG0799140.1 hypothetical protein [Methylocystis sp. L43]MBG0806484.1 hypothetical protein [Methylocystis sp. H15]
MRRVIFAILGLLAGYAAGAILGGTLISLLSGNTHDKDLEIVMTSAFVTGPLGALIGLLAGLFVPNGVKRR